MGKPRLTVAGVIKITAIMSMFMSNTHHGDDVRRHEPVIMAPPEGKAHRYRPLSIPLVAANVGGMLAGTPRTRSP